MRKEGGGTEGGRSTHAAHPNPCSDSVVDMVVMAGASIYAGMDEHERKVVIEFMHLLEKSKQLFNGLR